MFWPFILLGQIKRVPLTPPDLTSKSKLSALSGSVALRQLNPIHKDFFSILEVRERTQWELIQSLHLSFFEPDAKIEIFIEKEGAVEQSNVDFEIGVNAPAAKQCCRLRKISYRTFCFFCCLVTRKEQLFHLQTLGYYHEDSHRYPMSITILTFLNCRLLRAL